jgi:hypothetical protein
MCVCEVDSTNQIRESCPELPNFCKLKHDNNVEMFHVENNEDFRDIITIDLIN